MFSDKLGIEVLAATPFPTILKQKVERLMVHLLVRLNIYHLLSLRSITSWAVKVNFSRMWELV